jgi:hypothetical protein
VLAASAAPAQASRVRLGLGDDLAFLDDRAAPRDAAFARARRAGARLVRLTLDWSRVAPPGTTKPAGFDAEDPAAPEYRWGYIEDAVRSASDRHFGVVLTIVRAPPWAEPRGSPDPVELGRFARAAARRFSGFYPDPKRLGNGLTMGGAALPHVRYWQLWDEPNDPRNLQAGSENPADLYRRLLNAGARAVNAVDEDNVVVTAGTAARPGALAFWRRLLCLSARCTDRPRFDVYAHDPVTGRSPDARLRGGAIGVGELPRLSRLVKRAAPHKQLWITKLAWNTRPAAPSGLSPRGQSRYLARGLELAVERAGASAVIWEGLGDAAGYAGFPSIRSGLFDASWHAKPALVAFRFPFVVRHGLAWGISPLRRRSRVRIEHRVGRVWRSLHTVRTNGSGVFHTALRTPGDYRAHAGRLTSLPSRR